MADSDILFIHQNMPGQFRFLVAALARLPAPVQAGGEAGRYRVFFLSAREGVRMAGVTSVTYPRPPKGEPSQEALVRPLEASARYGRAVAKAALEMKARGISPRLVVVHPGWGEGLLIRDIWPDAKILSYAEYYYQPRGGDIGFDPMFPVTPNGLATARMMNANLLISHEQADALLCPTQWQKHRHPAMLQDRISVIFDGIDTARVCPGEDARFALPDGRVLTRADEVITYVARNLEPHRGYHVFMRTLPRLLAARPNAQVVIVGGEEVSYSPRAPQPHASWKDLLESEVDLGADAGRVHHLGKLAYADYLALLRISAAHVYLTYPFVLSWSCLEAMAAGCLMIASDTAPVREVIGHEANGLLFPFFDGEALVACVVRGLEDQALGDRLRRAGRETVVARYDLRECLAAQVRLVEGLLAG